MCNLPDSKSGGGGLHKRTKVLTKCHICESTFSIKYDLKRHNQEAHIKDKKFKCTICPDSAFHQKKILYDHCMYHHVKIKPYVCAVCGAEYWQKPIMGAHIAESHENWPKDKF